jgi:hypothetical protein
MTIDFKGAHYPKAVIVHAVFFYVRYAVSYRDLEEIIVGISYGSDRWIDPSVRQSLSVFYGQILRSAVGMMYQPTALFRSRVAWIWRSPKLPLSIIQVMQQPRTWHGRARSFC